MDAGASTQEVVAFKIGDQQFCVDIMCVREIRGWTPATPIPKSPHYVGGVINLRGNVLPVVDLALRLGLPTAEPNARHVIIVCQIRDRIVGLLVHAVSDIISIRSDHLQPTPDVASQTAHDFIRGVVAIGSQMISLITLEAVLPAKDREAA